MPPLFGIRLGLPAMQALGAVPLYRSVSPLPGRNVPAPFAIMGGGGGRAVPPVVGSRLPASGRAAAGGTGWGFGDLASRGPVHARGVVLADREGLSKLSHGTLLELLVI